MEETRQEPADDADPTDLRGAAPRILGSGLARAIENSAVGHLERPEDLGQERGRRVGDIPQVTYAPLGERVHQHSVVDLDEVEQARPRRPSS